MIKPVFDAEIFDSRIFDTDDAGRFLRNRRIRNAPKDYVWPKRVQTSRR